MARDANGKVQRRIGYENQAFDEFIDDPDNLPGSGGVRAIRRRFDPAIANQLGDDFLTEVQKMYDPEAGISGKKSSKR